jgi:hypothetical protein
MGPEISKCRQNQSKTPGNGAALPAGVSFLTIVDP